jgi:hypothetical protein
MVCDVFFIVFIWRKDKKNPWIFVFYPIKIIFSLKIFVFSKNILLHLSTNTNNNYYGHIKMAARFCRVAR